MKWEPVFAKAGDIVRVRLGSVYHFGVFVSEDEVIQFGLPPTAENRDKEGEVVVCATDIDAFACGQIVETAVLDRKEQRKRRSPFDTIAAARARLGGGGYNLLHNNCEHFVNECVFGESRSSQEEELRRRWANRPIFDVYLGRVPAQMPDVEIFPQKRRAEIMSIVGESLRIRGVVNWRLLCLASKRSLNLDPHSDDWSWNPHGQWICNKYHYSMNACEEFAAAAVSNGEVKVKVNPEFPSRGEYTYELKNPRVTVWISGEKMNAVKFFWVGGGAVRLLGKDDFI